MACAYTSLGADYIYLFNYMDNIDPDDLMTKPLFSKEN